MNITLFFSLSGVKRPICSRHAGCDRVLVGTGIWLCVDTGTTLLAPLACDTTTILYLCATVTVTRLRWNVACNVVMGTKIHALNTASKELTMTIMEGTARPGKEGEHAEKNAIGSQGRWRDVA